MKPRWKSVVELAFGGAFALLSAYVVVVWLNQPIDGSLDVLFIALGVVSMLAMSSLAAKAWGEI